MTEDERKELLRNWAMMESKSAKNNDTSDNDPLGKLERFSWIFVCSAILIFTTALLPALLAAMHDSILLLHGSEDEYYKGVVNIGAFVMFSPVYIIAFPAALVGLFWLLFEPIIELPDERSFEKYRKITSKLRLPFIWSICAVFFAGGLCMLYGMVVGTGGVILVLMLPVSIWWAWSLGLRDWLKKRPRS